MSVVNNDHGDAIQVDHTSSFASRNPTKQLQSSRARPRPKISDAAKITADAKRQQHKENASALRVEIVAFLDVRKTEIGRLAKKYNKSEAIIKQLLSNETSYQNTRAPSLRNALVHAKGQEVNEGEYILINCCIIQELTYIFRSRPR